MLMIETRARNPRQTADDISDVYDEAAKRALMPISIDVGFFQARDLLDFYQIQGWRRARRWARWSGVGAAPLSITQLEDRIVLHCLDAWGGSVPIVRDRRGSTS